MVGPDRANWRTLEIACVVLAKRFWFVADKSFEVDEAGAHRYAAMPMRTWRLVILARGPFSTQQHERREYKIGSRE